MANTIVWADIPVTDMDRARKFYAAVLEADIPLMDGANGDVALLPGEHGHGERRPRPRREPEAGAPAAARSTSTARATPKA